MNMQQKIAIASPARFAFETAQQKFGWLLGKASASLVLTVNNGYE